VGSTVITAIEWAYAYPPQCQILGKILLQEAKKVASFFFSRFENNNFVFTSRKWENVDFTSACDFKDAFLLVKQ